MPGRPKRRAAIAKVEALGGATYLEEYLLSGGTITGLARELDLDRGFLQRLVNNHDDYKRAMEAAREQGADAHAEAGFEIMRRLREERKAERKNADPNSKTSDLSALDVSIAKEEAAQHRFIAEAWNRSRYGNTANQTQITVNLGDMHLDALRKAKLVQDSTKTIEHSDE